MSNVHKYLYYRNETVERKKIQKYLRIREKIEKGPIFEKIKVASTYR